MFQCCIWYMSNLQHIIQILCLQPRKPLHHSKTYAHHVCGFLCHFIWAFVLCILVKFKFRCRFAIQRNLIFSKQFTFPIYGFSLTWWGLYLLVLMIENCEILTFWPIHGLHSHLSTFDVCVECRDCFRGFVRQKLMYSLWKVGWDKKFVHIFSVSICWWSPQWPNNHISSSLFKKLLGRKVNFVWAATNKPITWQFKSHSGTVTIRI